MNKYLYFLLLVFSINSLSAQITLDRVEPPFWWAGMKNDKLQLLVHGKNIGTTTPIIKHPDVNLERAIRVKSNNYLFIDLSINPSIESGSFVLSFTKEKELIHSYTYELKERIPGSADREGFSPKDVIYLITPDRFANGNPDNDYVDGMKEKPNRTEAYGRHGGDIQGLINNLNYIKNLGFSAIWLNPVLENDQAEQSYHGYATTDYYKVDPRFGSNNEYALLSKRASESGLKMIMDMIANHCGSEHWWMKDPPTDDWINNPDKYVNTNHRKEALLDPYGSAKERSVMVDGWFVPTMPDLNQRNDLMSTYLIQNSIWWVEFANLAGIRQDTYSYPDRYFMSDWTCALKEEYPNLFIVGEEWVEDPVMVAYWQEGKQNHDAYNSCLPSLMDFPLNFALRDGLKEEEEWGKGLINIYRTLSKDYVYADPSQLVIFPDNHDMSRIFTVVNEDIDLWKIAIAHTMTARGIPQLYYGTEILMSNPGTDSHGIIRSDFPGGWDGDEKNAFDGSMISPEASKAQNWVKQLLDWRKDAHLIHSGKMMHFIPANGLYVYFRYDEDGAIMVILNKTGQIDAFDTGYYSEITSKYTKAIDVFSGEEKNLGISFEIGDHPVLIYELE